MSGPMCGDHSLCAVKPLCAVGSSVAYGQDFFEAFAQAALEDR
jgi:hypothetical protein